jgi:hypothetical protein
LLPQNAAQRFKELKHVNLSTLSSTRFIRKPRTT